MPEVRMSDEPICDFCSEPKWAKRYQYKDFFEMDHSTGFQPLVSKGDWLACSACASHIDNENWTGLHLRALQKFSEKYPQIPRRILADRIKQTHDLFRQHYRKAKS